MSEYNRNFKIPMPSATPG